MIRRWLARWRRRREDLPAALRRALDAERARGGDVVSGPVDLGDLLSGRCGLPSVGEAAPDLTVPPEVDRCWCDVDRLLRGDWRPNDKPPLPRRRPVVDDQAQREIDDLNEMWNLPEANR